MPRCIAKSTINQSTVYGATNPTRSLFLNCAGTVSGYSGRFGVATDRLTFLRTRLPAFSESRQPEGQSNSAVRWFHLRVPRNLGVYRNGHRIYTSPPVILSPDTGKATLASLSEDADNPVFLSLSTKIFSCFSSVHIVN